MCPLIIRLLFNIYTSFEYFVKWNNFQSESFPVTNGVKQGGVISPILFTVYTNSLREKVRNEKYLGHFLSAESDIINFQSLIRDVKVRANCLSREFRHLCYSAKVKLFPGTMYKFLWVSTYELIF